MRAGFRTVRDVDGGGSSGDTVAVAAPGESEPVREADRVPLRACRWARRSGHSSTARARRVYGYGTAG
jgi:hypothetical protein